MVYLVWRLSDRKPFAAKAFKNIPTRYDVEECLFMQKIRDRFILGSIDCFINTDRKNDDELVIITELALYDVENYVLKTLKDQNIDEEEIKIILAQVVIAVSALHRDLKIVHRDLKPANILIFDDMKVKLSDFGFLKEIDTSKIIMSKCCTPMFTSPEVLGIVRGNVLPFKIDVYSLGLTACWMVTKSNTFLEDIKAKNIVFPH